MIQPIASNGITFTGKNHKNMLAQKMKQSFNKHMEQKYNVDNFESLDKEAKDDIKKDYTLEVGTCALATAALSVVCYSKTRNALKGSVDAISNSIKRMTGKNASLSDEAQGAGEWISEKVSAFLNKSSLKEKAAEVNSSVRGIVDREKNASIAKSKAADKIIDNISGPNKLLFKCTTGRAVAAEEMTGVITSLQEIGQEDLAASVYKKSQNGLKGDEGAKVLSGVVETVREKAGSTKTFNTSKSGLQSFADEIEAAGNKKLAGELRSFVPENAEEAQIIRIPFDKFNQTVQNNTVSAFRKNEPVQFDTSSRLHEFISKGLKNDEAVQTFEEKLGQNGIANGNDLIEAGASLAVGGIGGKEVLEAVDAVTDLNDEDIGDAATAKDRIIKAKQDHGKISKDDAMKLAKAAANLMMAG